MDEKQQPISMSVDMYVRCLTALQKLEDIKRIVNIVENPDEDDEVNKAMIWAVQEICRDN